ALTTSVCVDFLGVSPEGHGEGHDEDNQIDKKRRNRVHLLVTAAVAIAILIFRAVNDQSVIQTLFTVASYTYGPLLGLFAWSLWSAKDSDSSSKLDCATPWIAVAAPLAGYFIQSAASAHGFDFGFALLPVNGLLTWCGLWIASRWRGTGLEAR
ncbi:MAG: hypothetical protein P8M07_07135, partial [Flavobacteriales bacterium]|nr:hypothetical protein [Flavobacteriales bacterium]